jgi:ATP-dependent helicase/nuclease subunit A
LSKLNIYKSSAGSGKTFQLTANYLKLLLEQDASHNDILAVTFTNKASKEMKSRIIESLHDLAKGDEKSSRMAHEILKGEILDEKALFLKAEKILSVILNDYSSFSVSTIDKFFQSIIRSFAKESGLQAGYNLELNNSKILSEAIDAMMYSLDSDITLRNWLIRYAGDKISEGKDWNIHSDIFKLGNEIFKEQYREIESKSIPTGEHKVIIEKYRLILLEIIKKFENHLSGTGKSALQCIEDAGLKSDDFKYANGGVIGFFHRISVKKDFDPKKRARDAMNVKEEWCKSDALNRNEIHDLVEKKLNSLLCSAIEYYDEKIVEYNTALSIVRNLYAFGILNDLYFNVRQITFDQNLFLLSDANIFLKKIIAGNDAPFIYEKAGNYYRHFMLDEFQDTSRYQWDNFHPLITNGLAGGNESLIVGDVKQAIYRWRNSDWKILATEIDQSFPEYILNSSVLDTNWRSKLNIVAFNNALFSASSINIQNRILNESNRALPNPSFFEAWNKIIKEIYEQARQKVSLPNKDSEGFVEVSFYDMELREYVDMLNDRLPLLINDVLQRGYKQGDIAILVRKGKQGSEIAKLLMNLPETDFIQKINIISNDSLFIESHPSIRFLTALIKYLINPSLSINAVFIQHEYISYLASSDPNPGILNSIFLLSDNKGLKQGINNELDLFISHVEDLKRLPLFELIEELICLFDLGNRTDNIAFLQAYQDLVLDFVKKQSADISSFLNWWDLHGKKQTLTVSEDQDAIRIMTIHKSKGLQFPVVIVPFCDWTLDAENLENFIWCENHNPPFNFIENTPVRYGSSLLQTSFCFDYLDEKFKNFVDNLNILYVALTRPEEELYIFANTHKNETVAQIIQEIVSERSEVMQAPAEFPVRKLEEFYDPLMKTFKLGVQGSPVQKKKKSQPEFIDSYPVRRNSDKIRLNITNVWLEKNESDFNKKIGYGTVMHEILSEIETNHDIRKSVDKAVLKGRVPIELKDDLQQFLEKAMGSDIAKTWFDGSWKIIREREMVIKGNTILRPDRVMINGQTAIVTDFKFGHEISPYHNQQVLNYCKAIKSLGYEEVKGYVWYISVDKIMEVL